MRYRPTCKMVCFGCVTVTVVQGHLRSTTNTEYIYFTEKNAIKTPSELPVDKAGDADDLSPRFLLQTVFIALTHKVRTTATPTYLSELVQTHAPSPAICAHPMIRCWSFLAYPPNWPVALFMLLLHPPAAANIRLCENILTVKRHLKTYLACTYFC